MNDPLLEVLHLARATIAKPERWTKGNNARLVNQMPCFAHSPDAACFCAEGAIVRAARTLAADPESGYRYGTQAEAFRLLGGYVDCALHEYNDRDETTHADILALFDRAIAELEYHYAAPESAS